MSVNNITPMTDLHPLPEDFAFSIYSTVGGIPVDSQSRNPDDTYTVCVGQMGTHLAVCNYPILSVQWVITPGTAGVADYLISSQTGVVVPIPGAAMVQNPLVFAFAQAGNVVVGVYVVTPVGTGSAYNSFVVTAPQVNFLDSMTGAPQVRSNNTAGRLLFGPAPGQTDGIIINASLFGGQNVPGQVGILQLVNNQRFLIHIDGGDKYHWNLNNQWVLDVGPENAYIFYQNAMDTLYPGSNAQFEVTDTPSSDLASFLQLVSIGDQDSDPETYMAYLMFQPVGQGSIFVPLSVLTWFWAGYTEREGDNWSPVKNPENSVNPLGEAATVFPQWTNYSFAGAWVPGMGQAKSLRQPGIVVKSEED